ncbi:hypothetical protein ACIP88_27345 [Streptomyces uncialis]|uniref:hypothetical protein n=1 Tax=Streptomyces uncialis TaxID=1048205 RepID=UPI003814E1DD
MTRTPSPPCVGALLVDMSRRKIGEYCGRVGPYWALRPVGGGREWDADPSDVRAATADERRVVRLGPRPEGDGR